MGPTRQRRARASVPAEAARIRDQARRFYDEVRRLANVDPAFAAAAALPPWEALPEWGQRRLAWCAAGWSGDENLDGRVRRLLDEGFATARAVVDAWLDSPMGPPRADVEALVREVAAKLLERDLRLAVLAGELDDR